MRQWSKNCRRVLAIRALAVLLCALVSSACNRQVQIPPPPSPDRFSEAEDAFLSGDYARAAQVYTELLSKADPDNPAEPFDTDRALYRLGLIYMLPDSPSRDPQKGHAYLRRLLEESPETPFAVEARMILGLEARLESVQSGLQHTRSELYDLMFEIQSMRSMLEILEIENDQQRAQIILHLKNIADRNDQIEAQSHQMARLTEELSRVRAELDRMKEIDLSRRPPN